jgi:hypothetical protein
MTPWNTSFGRRVRVPLKKRRRILNPTSGRRTTVKR